jgi:hypothetical protein
MARQRMASRVTRLTGAALFFTVACLGPGSCGGSAEPAPGPQDAGGGDAPDVTDALDAPDGAGGDATDAPLPCDARHAALEFIFANKGCSTTDDCVVALTCLREAESCDNIYGATYLSVSHDQAQWKALESALSVCGEPYCVLPGCASYADPPVCWKGTCWPFRGPEDLANREACLTSVNRDSLCARCYCALAGAGGLCENDSACTKLVQCAMDKACFGSPSCAPTNASSPCSKEVAAVGGPSNPSVVLFGAINQELHRSGCDVPCEK